MPRAVRTQAWRLTISEGQRCEVTQALEQALESGVARKLIGANPAASIENQAH